ncbi:MAG: hypothetical protein SGJ20_20120 [Planctomycetota bacterium]|nr:hypothetical protein [Planctomycetota bacterium]
MLAAVGLSTGCSLPRGPITWEPLRHHARAFNASLIGDDCAECAEAMPAGQPTGDPMLAPPISKFHPVPTRPAFAPREQFEPVPLQPVPRSNTGA